MSDIAKIAAGLSPFMRDEMLAAVEPAKHATDQKWSLSTTKRTGRALWVRRLLETYHDDGGYAPLTPLGEQVRQYLTENPHAG